MTAVIHKSTIWYYQSWNYCIKFKSIDSNKASLSKPSLRLLRPLSVRFLQLLLFASQSPQIIKFPYPQKFRLIDFKKIILCKPSLNFLRPSSVILSHLSTSQFSQEIQISDPQKLRSIDCKEPSLFRLSPRVLRLLSARYSLLKARQQHIWDNKSFLYHWRSRLRYLKEQRQWKPSKSFLRPLSVKSWPLFILETFNPLVLTFGK